MKKTSDWISALSFKLATFVFFCLFFCGFAGTITNFGIWQAGKTARDSRRALIETSHYTHVYGESFLLVKNLLEESELHIEFNITRQNETIFTSKHTISPCTEAMLKLPSEKPRIIKGDKYVIHVTDSILGIKDVIGFFNFKN